MKRGSETKLKVTDIPEKVLASHAKMLGIDVIDLIDAIVIKGDNAFFPLSVGEPSAWIWSREDADDDEIIDEADKVLLGSP